MRVRKKKHGAERIAACADMLIASPELLRNGYSNVFPKNQPIHIEIGCGKGNFACGMARKYPDINFIALEKVGDVCCVALEKAKADENGFDNLKFIIADAKELAENIPAHSVDCIYLNFSDPWPKSGHAKRRLTHRGFLEIYKKLLKEDGILKLKTDNIGLFDFSIEEFEAMGMQTLFFTRDLHSEGIASENVMTEYEKNFSEKGFSICSAWVKF